MLEFTKEYSLIKINASLNGKYSYPLRMYEDVVEIYDYSVEKTEKIFDVKLSPERVHRAVLRAIC